MILQCMSQSCMHMHIRIRGAVNTGTIHIYALAIEFFQHLCQDNVCLYGICHSSLLYIILINYVYPMSL